MKKNSSSYKRFLKSQKLARSLVATAINKTPLNFCDFPMKFTILSKSPTLIIQFPFANGIDWGIANLKYESIDEKCKHSFEIWQNYSAIQQYLDWFPILIILIIFGVCFPLLIQIIQTFSIEKLGIWLIIIFTIWMLCSSIYNLTLGFFGITELQAFSEKLIIKDKLFSIVIKKTIISKTSLFLF